MFFINCDGTNGIRCKSSVSESHNDVDDDNDEDEDVMDFVFGSPSFTIFFTHKFNFNRKMNGTISFLFLVPKINGTYKEQRSLLPLPAAAATEADAAKQW